MYESHFGFSEKPFELTPDPAFLYISHEIREILATLKYGIMERRGFVLLVGEPGTGKTTLINTLMDMPGDDTSFAYVFNPAFDFDDLLQTVLVEFGIASEDETISRRRAIRKLNEYAIDQYEKGRNTVIVVDEAQYLDIQTIENLRLLSNLETRKHKLFQLIIAGQPELEHSLSHPKLVQLRQRIGLRRRTKPFSEKEAREYIDHRLKTAGYEGPELFGNLAMQMIWRQAGGIPRLINILCDSALLIGYASSKTRIDKAIVIEAIADLKTVPIDDGRPKGHDARENNKAATAASIPEAGPDSPFAQAKPSERNRAGSTVIAHQETQKSQSHAGPQVSAGWRRLWNKAFSAPVPAVILIVVLTVALVTFLFLYANQRYFKREFFTMPGRMTPSGQKAEHSAEADIQSKLGQLDKKIEAMKASIDQKFAGNPKGQPESDPNPKNGPSDKSFDRSAPRNGKNGSNAKRVTVEKGESLSGILIREYGRLDPRLLSLVLTYNPEIKNPDYIVERQVIILPEETASAFNKED